MQGNMNYNRPSGGYQKNMYKQMINAEGVKQPKAISEKTIKWGGIAIGVCWIALSIALVVTLKWKGLLIALVVGALLTGGMYLFLQHKQKEMITYYKKIGMTEEMYINEVKKRNSDKKQVEAARKMWRKVKAESVVPNTVKKSTKSGKSGKRK